MTPEVFEAVLADVAAGEAASTALAEREVNRRTFWAHLAKDDEAANKYARAKSLGLERLADEIIDIADAREGDVMLDEETGRRLIDNEAVQRARLRVDSRKWLLSKLAPKKYGDKLGLTGGDGEGPIEITATWRDK